MSTNPLKKAADPRRGAMRAAEYAMRAEENGRRDLAKLWWEADRNGWDDDNYDPGLGEERRRKIAEARKAWGGR